MYGDPATSHTGTLVRPFNLPSLEMVEDEQIWKIEYDSLREESKDLITESPDARDVIRRVLRTPNDIGGLTSCTPTKVGESDAWTQIVISAKDDRAKLCEILRRRRRFSALYSVYSLSLNELKAVLLKCVCETKTCWNLVMSPDWAQHQDNQSYFTAGCPPAVK